MPVFAVILHHKRAGAGQVEHYVKPRLPASDRDTHVLTAAADHIVEQCEESTLQLGCRVLAGQRAEALPALDLVTTHDAGMVGSHAAHPNDNR